MSAEFCVEEEQPAPIIPIFVGLFRICLNVASAALNGLHCKINTNSAVIALHKWFVYMCVPEVKHQSNTIFIRLVVSDISASFGCCIRAICLVVVLGLYVSPFCTHICHLIAFVCL